MSTQDAEEQTEFPHGIGKVAHRELALAANGYTRYQQLTRVPDKVGYAKVERSETEDGEAARGLAFASS